MAELLQRARRAARARAPFRSWSL